MSYLRDFYLEFMKLVSMPDTDEKGEAMKSFFDKLNRSRLPEYFNWAEEVVEGIHLRERGDRDALVWVSLDTWDVKKFTYSELVGESNRLINYLRGHGLGKGSKLYVMLPLVPEIFFATYATVKGGFVGVPTATIMTSRELEYRFKVFPPDGIIADVDSAKVMDEAIERTGVKPRVKLVVGGDRSGWDSYDAVRSESPVAEAEKN